MIELTESQMYLGIFGLLIVLVLFLGFYILIQVIIIWNKRPKQIKKSKLPKLKLPRFKKQEIKAEKIIKQKKDSKATPRLLFKTLHWSKPMNFILPTAWKNWWRAKTKVDKTLLIHMEMANGIHRSFIVLPNEDRSFTFRNKRYVCDEDPDMMSYNLDNGIWQYWFHENFSIPYRLKFPVSEVKSQFQTTESKQVRLNTNPETLEKYVKSDIAAGVLSGEALTLFFKRVIIIIFITLGIVLVNLLISIYASGIFQELQKVMAK